MINESLCCGVREIHELSDYQDPEQFLLCHLCVDEKDWGNRYNRSTTVIPGNFRYAYFTQAGEGSTYGTSFAEYIKKHQLGEVIETAFNVNPNSGNQLKMWVWTVNHDALKTWAETKGRFHPIYNEEHGMYQHIIDMGECYCDKCESERDGDVEFPFLCSL